MNFSFGQLIAHVARKRRITAGGIIGSGTVSNADPAAGSACIAERRAMEIIAEGRPKTEVIRFGDRVQMAARNVAGDEPFGRIAQRVVCAGFQPT